MIFRLRYADAATLRCFIIITPYFISLFSAATRLYAAYATPCLRRDIDAADDIAAFHATLLLCCAALFYAAAMLDIET